MRSSIWRGAIGMLALFVSGAVLGQSPNVAIPVQTNATGMRVVDYSPNVLTAALSIAPVSSILYAPSEADDPAYRAAISAAAGGATVDYFDTRAATPDLATLQTYGCVYTWANFAYADNVTFGNNLAAYVDGGGSVVLGAFCTYTSGSSLSGLIMTPAYCPVVSPAGNNHFADSAYAGDGITQIHIGVSLVSAYNCVFRDFLALQGTGIQDGSFLDAEIACAYRPDFRVIYTNGAGASALGCAGEWAALVANSALAAGGPPACLSVGSLTASVTCPDVDLSWTLNDTYTELRVLRNGSLIATLAGTAISYTDISPSGGAPATVQYQIEADCGPDPAFPATTSVVVCPSVRILYAPSEADDATLRANISAATSGLCDYFDARAATPSVATLIADYDVVYSWANFPFLDSVAMGDALAAFADVPGKKVILGSFCTYTSGSSMSGQIMTDAYCPVVSPAGTNHFASDSYIADGVTCMYGTTFALECTFRDFLVTQGCGVTDGTYADGEICGAYNEHGPAVYYANGSGATQLGCSGDWANFIADIAVCTPPAPGSCQEVGSLTCVSDCAGSVDMTWINGGAYSNVIVEVNGALQATLPGTAESYSFAPASAGPQNIVVRGDCGGGDFSCPRTCSATVIPIGGNHIILALELASIVDSVGALEASLNTLGQTFTTITDPAALQACGPFGGKMLWVMLGTFPSNHQLTAVDADALTAHLTAGGALYVEGGDTWGFDPQTSFEAYDGVAPGAADGDDSFLSMVGTPGGPLDNPIWAAGYIQDQAGNDWTDRIQPLGESGGISTAIWNEGSGLYTTGIFNDRSADPFGSNLCQSWELGGYGGDRDALVDEYISILGFAPPIVDQFTRGDSNADGSFNIADAVATLNVLFPIGPPPTPPCRDALDSNDDGSLNIADAVASLGTLFPTGPPLPLPPPFPGCGVDPTADPLDCLAFPFCP